MNQASSGAGPTSVDNGLVESTHRTVEEALKECTLEDYEQVVEGLAEILRFIDRYRSDLEELLEERSCKIEQARPRGEQEKFKSKQETLFPRCLQRVEPPVKGNHKNSA